MSETGLRGVRFLFGTGAYNAHAQNMARALYEEDALYAYVTGGVDSYRSAAVRALRRAAGAVLPLFDRELKRRAIDVLPPEVVVARWGWEGPRTLASRLGMNERFVDWLWERGELALDRTCAGMVALPEVGGFLGVEYATLASLQAAKRLGKPGVVAFLSPHHRALSKWVDTEYEKFPELATTGRAYLDSLAVQRNDRRDQEAHHADWIVSGSSFTTRSLVDAGVPAAKIITVPLGGPAPIAAGDIPERTSTIRVVYVGPVSVRKGAHYLLRAWQKAFRPGMELHLYGTVLLPDSVCRAAQSGPAGHSIVFHGSVPARELTDVYRHSSILILPTLCDGFGLVVSDALANGLPVVTTSNAGAADLISDGRNGFIIPPADEDAIVGRLTWCAEHPQELFAMRRPALESAAGWTWADFRRGFAHALGDALATPTQATAPSAQAATESSTRRATSAARRRERICIVTPGYLSSTPRVVREADALSDAGYDVRVAFTQGQVESSRAFDRGLLATRTWRASAFKWSDRYAGERWAYHMTRGRHRLARALPPSAWDVSGLLERAESRVYPELAALAASEQADVYIGHYPDGLCAACHAGRRHGAAIGYDVEDLYPDTLKESPETAHIKARIIAIERRYLPECHYVSAVSEPVATAFAERYQRERPTVVHNCHSWSEREQIDGVIRQRTGPELSLYWFSQTVGLDRGLQDIIYAAGLLDSRVQIHLQGVAHEHVKQDLLELAARCGVVSSLHFHGPVPPNELVSRASEHDIGLALETDEILNRRLAVTNKQFLYMLAGLAIVASDIPGQRSVMETCPAAGVLYAPGDYAALAAHLAEFAKNPGQLNAAKRASLTAARTRWNWETEGRQVVAAVERVLHARIRLAG